MKKIFLVCFILFVQLAFAQSKGVNVPDKPLGGTLDLGSSSKFNLNQTTPGQTIAIPNPTNSVVEISVLNVGSVPFTLVPGGLLDTATFMTFKWVGTGTGISITKRWVYSGGGTISGGGGGPPLIQTVTNGDQTHATSGDAVYDFVQVVKDDLATHIANVNNPHSVTKAQVGLGNADNTSDANKPVSGPQLTALNLKLDVTAHAAGTLSGTSLASNIVTSSLTSVGTLTNLIVTNTITGNISGNAATATTLQTSRTIDGVSFNGSANITVIAPATDAANSKTTPVDADELPLVNSASSNVLAKLTWANLKATLKTYFDGLYFQANSQSVISGNVINWNITHQYLTLTGNTTFTFSNAADTKIIMVYISNASTSYTVTWPAEVKWGINGAPVQTVGTNTDVYTFSQVNGIIYGAVRQ